MLETVVVDGTAATGLDPIGVQPFELVGVAHALRRAQMDSGVADLEASVARFENPVVTDVDRPAIDGHLDHVDQRRKRGRLAGVGVEHRQATAGGKPEASIGGAASYPPDRVARRTLGAAQAIFDAVVDRCQRANPA